MGIILAIGLFAPAAFAEPSSRTITCADGQPISISNLESSADFNASCTSPVDHGGYNPTPAPVVNADPAATDPSTELDTKPNDCKDSQLTQDNCAIVRYLVIFINVLSVTVGVVVTAVIVWGGIEYSTSGGDPSKVQAAKKKIYNGVFSLIAFIFTYAFLQYIVPGGVL